MSASSVALANATAFRSRALFNKLSSSQIVQGFNPIAPDEIRVSNRAVVGTWQYTDIQSGGNWGSTATFKIPNQSGLIYDMFLDVTLPADAVTYAALPAVNLVQRYTVTIGNLLIDCSGESLFEADRAFANQNYRTFMIQSAGGSGGTGMASTNIQLQLDYPGKIRSSKPGLVHSFDAACGTPFPLNKCNADMLIQFTLQSAANMVSTGSAPTGQPTLRLWYLSVASDGSGDMTPANASSTNSALIPGYRVNEVVSNGAVTFTAGSQTLVDLSPSLLDAELIWILVKAKLASDITAKNFFTSQIIKELHEKVNNNDYYQHYNDTCAAYMNACFVNENPYDFIAAGATAGQAVNLYTYQIPQNISPVSDVFGAEWAGYNLYRQSAYLQITPKTASGAGVVYAATVNKCYWIISPAGSIDVTYTGSSNM